MSEYYRSGYHLQEVENVVCVWLGGHNRQSVYLRVLHLYSWRVGRYCLDVTMTMSECLSCGFHLQDEKKMYCLCWSCLLVQIRLSFG